MTGDNIMKIGWLPGDGIGVEVLEAVKIVLDAVKFDAEYISGRFYFKGS